MDRHESKYIASLPYSDKPWRITTNENGDVICANPDHEPLFIGADMVVKTIMEALRGRK